MIIFRSKKEKKDKCPQCGATLNAAIPQHESAKRPPVAGDLTLCIRCAAVLTFTDDATLAFYSGSISPKLKRTRKKLLEMIMRNRGK